MTRQISAIVFLTAFAAAVWGAAERPRPAATPRTIPVPKADAVVALWPDAAPGLVQGGKPEAIVNERYTNVSAPQLLVYLPPREKAVGAALIVCPGGGYGHLATGLHVENVVKLLNERGIAVFGLKYRTRYGNNDVVADALADGRRAVRLVRGRAKEWGVDPRKIGVQGYSAGANLCLNLAGHFDAGDPQAADPVERLSSRPDFIALMCPWPNKQAIEAYPLRRDTPPTFIASARDDKTAPFAFATAIAGKLKALGVGVEFFAVDTGGHSAFHYGAQPGEGAKWPDALLPWLKKIGMW